MLEKYLFYSWFVLRIKSNLYLEGERKKKRILIIIAAKEEEKVTSTEKIRNLKLEKNYSDKYKNNNSKPVIRKKNK